MFPISIIVIPLIFIYFVVNIILGYRLGKAKIRNGKLGALFSFVFSLFPPCNFVFFAFLMFKKDDSVNY